MYDPMMLAQLLQGLGGLGGDPFAGAIAGAGTLPPPIMDPMTASGLPGSLVGPPPPMGMSPAIGQGIAPELGPNPFGGGVVPGGMPGGAGGGLAGLLAGGGGGGFMPPGAGKGLPTQSADQKPIFNSAAVRPPDPKVQGGMQSAESQALLQLLMSGGQMPGVLGASLRGY